MQIQDKGDNARPAALPRLTKRALEIADEQQLVWAHHHPTEGNRRVSNAVARIKELEELNLLTADQKEKLAEAYAVTGQFARAAKITTDESKSAKWVSVWKAINKKDDIWCKCPDTETVDQHGKIHKLSPKHLVTKVFSHRDNREVGLYRCNACGMINTTAN